MPVLAGAWYPKPNKTLILPDRAGPSSFHPHPVKLGHIGGMLPGLKLRQMAWFLSVGPAEYPSFARCTRSLDCFGYCFYWHTLSSESIVFGCPTLLRLSM
jgi:hypothetical protein